MFKVVCGNGKPNEYITQLKKSPDPSDPGDEIVEVIGHEFCFVVKPRKGLRPTTIYITTSVGEFKLVKQTEGILGMELFIDKTQKGISPNPITTSQKEFLEKKL